MYHKQMTAFNSRRSVVSFISSHMMEFVLIELCMTVNCALSSNL